MGKLYDSINEELAAWIASQHMFFVATAPLSKSGSVNCSPKGGNAFRVLGPSEVAYQDLTGSGAETIAHLRENGRIVVMFCAFEGPPKIVRLHGRGAVITPGHARYEELVTAFPAHLGTRAIILIDVDRVSDSCGYGVPLYAFKGPRDALDKWSQNKGAEKLKEYRRTRNAVSIDGLPGVETED